MALDQQIEPPIGGDGSTGCFKNAANAKASARTYNAKATGATVMMASSIVFELLGKMLWAEDMSQDENYRQFAWNMHLAPSGVSLDPSFSAAFESDAPDCFASKADALEYCARFLASELVEFWGIPAGQAIVEQLETLSRKGSREGILPAIRRFDDALTLLALRASS